MAQLFSSIGTQRSPAVEVEKGNYWVYLSWGRFSSVMTIQGIPLTKNVVAVANYSFSNEPSKKICSIHSGISESAERALKK